MDRKMSELRPVEYVQGDKNILRYGERSCQIGSPKFKIGPRINACGRIHSGRAAVELLITEDEAFARQQAEAVNTYNTERKDYDTRTTEEALKLLRQDPDNEQKHTSTCRASGEKTALAMKPSSFTISSALSECKYIT